MCLLLENNTASLLLFSGRSLKTSAGVHAKKKPWFMGSCRLREYPRGQSRHISQEITVDLNLVALLKERFFPRPKVPHRASHWMALQDAKDEWANKRTFSNRHDTCNVQYKRIMNDFYCICWVQLWYQPFGFLLFHGFVFSQEKERQKKTAWRAFEKMTPKFASLFLFRVVLTKVTMHEVKTHNDTTDQYDLNPKGR